jgi:hypothetical protein
MTREMSGLIGDSRWGRHRRAGVGSGIGRACGGQGGPADTRRRPRISAFPRRFLPYDGANASPLLPIVERSDA